MRETRENHTDNGEAQALTESAASNPTNAWIALTNRCNLRCAHCAIRFDENRKTPEIELSDAAFDAFASQVLPHLNTLKMGGNNLGEQLAADTWDARSERILASNVELTVQTNGILLSDETIERLVSAGAEFDISVEGVDRESYASIRGDHFDRVMQAVERIGRARSAHPESASRIIFSFAIFYDNCEQLLDLVRLAADTGVDGIAVMHLMPVWEEQRYQSLVYHRAFANDVIAEAQRLAEELGVEMWAPRPFDLGVMSRKHNRPVDAAAGSHSSLRPCPHPWTSVSVNEKGEVTPCCNSYMVMGNLNSQPFESIWNNRRYRRLRETVNTPRAPVNCRTCVLRDYAGTDEAQLLSAIGPNADFSQSMVLSRMIQRRLRASRFGARFLPFVKNVYRRRIS